MPDSPTSRTSAAFTLIELLVVVAVIGLLVALLAPSVGLSRRYAKKAVCQENLKGLWTIFHGGAMADEMAFPGYRTWVSVVAGHQAHGILRCPEDHVLRSTERALEDAWIKQLHGGVLYKYPLLDLYEGLGDDHNPGDANSTFFQVYLEWTATDVLEVHVGGSADNYDGGVRITFGKVIRFECLDAPNDYGCISDHFIMCGEEEIMRLQGINYHEISDPVELTTFPVSYGMNKLTRVVNTPARQLVLLDYTRTVADPVADAVDQPHGYLDPDRHLGKVNVVFGDGHVDDVWPAEVDADEPVWAP